MAEVFQPTSPQPLGQRPAPDNNHRISYPLTAFPTLPTRVPVIIGVDWYDAFDRPIYRDGKWWIPTPDVNWGSIRGGHAVCLKPVGVSDLEAWWIYYDQAPYGGACVAEACCRAKTLLERARFLPQPLYFEAQKIDPWPGGAYPGASPFYEGTAVRSGLEVMRTKGLKTAKKDWTPAFGIAAYRWTRSIVDIKTVLGLPETATHCQLLNSWGKGGYPHVTQVPFSTLEVLLVDGEAAVITDR